MTLFFGTPFKYWHLHISALGLVNLLWQLVWTSSRLWRCGNCTMLECNRRLSLHTYGNEPQEWRWLPHATRWLSWDYRKRALAPSQVQASFPASNCTGTGTPTTCPSQSQRHGPQEGRRIHIFRASSMSFNLPQVLCICHAHNNPVR